MKKTELAEYLFHQGTNFNSYSLLGCNKEEYNGKIFLAFRVWAPNADGAWLVSDIYGWDKQIELNRTTEAGLWELIIELNDDYFGKKYKFKIKNKDKVFYKGDPYAFWSLGGDDGASIIYDKEKYNWSDSFWLNRRKTAIKKCDDDFLSIPINIYELHIGSFLRNENAAYYSYRQLAEVLPTYLKRLSFTHVEFMPIQEYPFDGSWGYQVCGFFSVTSRFGTPDDFKYLVDTLHNHGIGVIIDFVCAHFPKDEWGLYEFDGAPLYEYQGVDRQESKMWGTRFFDLGREEVQSFLISSALYFLRELHVDGLRVDAVASMLYLDYDRCAGEWIPNNEGTNENKEAVAFLKKLNSAISSEFSDVLMIAEESGSYGKITKRKDDFGLGFDLKWNMGFANDFYKYVSIDPIYRKYVHSALNFPITYAFSENYILPISHDEVVHGKKSFADKMYGKVEEKLQEARLSLLFIMSFPGKKLGFMGYEFAQFREWDYSGELEWFMLDYENHRNFREYVISLNSFYLASRALWEKDFSQDGFAWISCDENDKNIICYKRIGKGYNELFIALNFSGIKQTLVFSHEKIEELKIIFHTGNYYGNNIITNSEKGFTIELPARCGVILEDTTYLYNGEKYVL